MKKLDNTTCFNAHKQTGKKCKNKKCRYWHNLKESNNCVINKTSETGHTLQEIGDIFNITRMRVCQIEKNAIEKLRLSSNALD